MRYALYVTPDRDHPLTRAAASWLGRDAFSGDDMSITGALGLEVDDLSKWTAEPRRYGFHGTLVAPFRLEQGVGEMDVMRAAETFAAQFAPIDIPRLKVTQLKNFLALMPARPNTELDALASAAVDRFSPMRAPLTEREIVRRNPDRLTDRQRAYLEQYGYPYVKDEYRFHMTLTGSVTDAEAGRIEPVLRDLLAPVLAPSIEIDAVALFVEPEPGAPFTVHSTYPLRANEIRKTVSHA
jgi:putative phosphonate metabolism protein